MKANETRVEEFLSGNNRQFVVPVYQRNYAWSIKECKQLLDDILEVGIPTEKNVHFIGSIVYVHDDVYTVSSIKELTVIDGQQRLTTLTIIYLVIHKLAKEINNEALVNEISETYLINKFGSDKSVPEEEKLKLRPTDNNDLALKYLLRGDDNEEYSDFSILIDNFNYFKERITQENIEFVLTGLSKLMFVEISLDREKDDPQRIFESLNSTGLELSQADLIRNYILMGLKRKSQKKIYQNYWEVIEKLAKDETHNDKVSDFIRDYLTLENKKIPNKGKVYIEFKANYPISTIDELEKNLSGLKSLVKHYNKLVNPKNEVDKDIRLQLEYVNRLEINVAYPFLMKVYDDYSNSIIDKSTFLKVLELIQSFTWRRFIISLPTNVLNKIFMSLYDKVNESDYLFSIQRYLLQRTGGQRFPKDTEVIDALKVKDVYHIKPKNKRYLLDRLENHNNNEPVVISGNQNITIEHIFPQNPDPKWEIELGNDEYIFVKENYLNTIGNLTLSGYNGKLKNKPFLFKRDLEDYGYKDSKLWLNQYISSLEKWDKEEIEKRFDILKDRFLKIWSFPDISIEEEKDSSEFNIFEVEDPKYKKLEYAVFFDRKIEVTQIAELYVEIIKQLFELQPETFFTTDLGVKIGLTKNIKESNTKQAVAVNDTYFIEGNIDSMGKFDRIKQALTTFNFEDELTIKYAEKETTKAQQYV